jgi:hypothetical protein
MGAMERRVAGPPGLRRRGVLGGAGLLGGKVPPAGAQGVLEDELKIITFELFTSLDPADDYSPEYLRSVGVAESLLRITPQGQVEVDLAQSLEQVDPLTWKVALRPEALGGQPGRFAAGHGVYQLGAWCGRRPQYQSPCGYRTTRGAPPQGPTQRVRVSCTRPRPRSSPRCWSTLRSDCSSAVAPAATHHRPWQSRRWACAAGYAGRAGRHGGMSS